MNSRRSKPSRREARPGAGRRWLSAGLLLLVAAAVASVATRAQVAPPAPGGADAPPNFDIRDYKHYPRVSEIPAAADYVAKFAASPRSSRLLSDRLDAGLQLSVAVPGVRIEEHATLTSTEVVSATPGGAFLTPPSDDRVATLRQFVAAFAGVYGLSPAEVGDLALVSDYANPAGNMSWVELEQRFHGIPVFQGRLRGGFTAKGALAATTGVLAGGIVPEELTNTPAVAAEQAVAQAASLVGWKVTEPALSRKSDLDGKLTMTGPGMADDATAWLVYFPLAPGVVRLAWATQIMGSPDSFLTVLDADDGTMLFRKNLTNYQTQSATYNVYTSDSPAPSSPTTIVPGTGGPQAPFVARSSQTLIGNEAPNTFNNLGWITDGGNTTDGNNVEAGLDIDGTNGVDAPVAGSARVFNFAYDPAVDAPTTANYRNGDVTNMFYWVNRYHDATYLLGFTEAAGNFQNNNFGRGGVAADRISAETQDSSGTNNANFATPADGGRGRMQMYIWNGPNPDRSGGLDQDVVFHELTHGLSNRLHGNASGLSTNMAGGMGEGWGDYYARSLLSTADENANGVFTVGGWATNLAAAGYTDNYYYGIRRFPYAVRSNVGANGLPHSPLTFADIDSTQANLGDGAFPRGPFGVAQVDQVHNIGEVWAGMLWEVRARFIARLGFPGNQRLLQFVTDGMKLDPAAPTMLQARNSIIAAANAGGGTAADIADIWAGFATRGMGFSAQITNIGGTANTTRVVEAFDLPGINRTTATLVSESIPNGYLDPNETVGVSFCLINSGAATSGALTGTLAATGGVTSPSSPQSFGTLAPGASACRTFTFVVSATCGTSVTATLQETESGGPSKTFVYPPLEVGGLTAAFSQNFDGVAAPALPAGWTTSTLAGTANLWATNATAPDTAPNRAFSGDPATVSDNVLLSPVVALPVGSSRVTFRNNFATESTFDGGVLEIAVNGGAFQDIIAAGGTFVAGGYTGLINTTFSSPIGGRQAWTGSSGGYITSTVAMPPTAGGQNVQLRWRMASDSSIASTGWAVDSIVIGVFSCAAPTTIQPPTNLRVTSLVGSTATMRWNPPAVGPAATGYLLEAGVAPGNVIAVLPLGAVPSFTVDAPNGSFYVRVRALGTGGPSAVSNEVPLHVNVPLAPSAPGSLLGTVAGSTLSLAWTNTFGGGSPSGLTLDVTGTLSGSLPLGMSDSFSLAGVPPGTYTFSLRASNGAGTSPSSNPVTLTFPGGCSGAPLPPANFLAFSAGGVLSLAWDTAASGAAPSSFVLDVTGGFVGAVPIAGRGITAGVPPGSYTFRVQAVNACGGSAFTAPQTVVVP